VFKIRIALPLLLALSIVPADLVAQQADRGSRGIFIESADGIWSTALQFRLQFRISNPYDSDPNDLGDFDTETTNTAIRRARMKVNGRGFQPWLAYYMEFDVGSASLLNYELKVEPSPRFNFKVGQWKANYTRERIVSSGRQLTVDRSLINRPFTIDRQQGLSIYGHLAEGTAGDLNYWVSAFTGMGRAGTRNDDTDLMYMGRLQWSPLGNQVPFRSGDNARSEEAQFSLAIGANTNNSPCTRFSGSGCGTLEGYSSDGDYRVQQAMFETAFHYRGFSWAQEYHWKNVRDNDTSAETELTGNYVMVGYFPSELIEGVPEPLELGFRWSEFRPDDSVDASDWRELTFAVNWFFADHDNKITAEYALFRAQQATSERNDGRVRLQWDIQF
jgi:phosphate-selective porin OprO/OprP